MKKKTAELIGAALDWAIATAQERIIGFDPMGFSPKGPNGGFWVWEDHDNDHQEIYHRSIGYSYSPSTSWAQGGPIVESEKTEFDFDEDEQTFRAYDGVHGAHGPTHLIAAMRCYVASKLGDEIDIPDALL